MRSTHWYCCSASKGASACSQLEMPTSRSMGLLGPTLHFCKVSPSGQMSRRSAYDSTTAQGRRSSGLHSAPLARSVTIAALKGRKTERLPSGRWRVATMNKPDTSPIESCPPCSIVGSNLNKSPFFIGPPGWEKKLLKRLRRSGRPLSAPTAVH
ncbi:hypothetical protein D3C84_861940 [compost metagenome]